MKKIMILLFVLIMAPISFLNADSLLSECEANSGRDLIFQIIRNHMNSRNSSVFSGTETFNCGFDTLPEFAKISENEYIVSPYWDEKLYTLNVQNNTFVPIIIDGFENIDLNIYHEQSADAGTVNYILIADDNNYALRGDNFYKYNVSEKTAEAISNSIEGVPVAITKDGQYLITIEYKRDLNIEIVQYRVYEENNNSPVFSYTTDQDKKFQIGIIPKVKFL